MTFITLGKRKYSIYSSRIYIELYIFKWCIILEIDKWPGKPIKEVHGGKVVYDNTKKL